MPDPEDEKKGEEATAAPPNPADPLPVDAPQPEIAADAPKPEAESPSAA